MPRVSQAGADRAAETQSRYQAQFKRIESNAALSRDAKDAALAKAYLGFKTDMDKLQLVYVDQSASNADAIERDVFGARGVSGADAISFRDAQDRAARLETPEEAATLLTRATQAGDDLLARAIGRHVWDQVNHTPFGGGAWGPLMQSWADARPGTADKLNQLLENTANEVRDTMAVAFTFVAPKPSRLGSMTEAQIVRLAQSPEASAAATVLG